MSYSNSRTAVYSSSPSSAVSHSKSTSHQTNNHLQSAYQPTSEPPMTNNKKKFGKNLNKLTKPPAPPIASEGKSTSRNGLLLLSTKRASTGNSTSTGLLSKPLSKQPLPSLGLQYESNTSTQELLLGAVVGASRAEQQPDAWGVAEKKDTNVNLNGNGNYVGNGGGHGHGYANANANANEINQASLGTAGPGMGQVQGVGIGSGTTRVGMRTGEIGIAPPPGVGLPTGNGFGPSFSAAPVPLSNGGTGFDVGSGAGASVDVNGSLNVGLNVGVGIGVSSLYEDNRLMEAENTNPSWDDYGGRGTNMMAMGNAHTPTKAHSPQKPPRYDFSMSKINSYDNINGNHHVAAATHNPSAAASVSSSTTEEDDQGAYMARLARERAERRRQEEEMRDLEQKEKAAQRLRELEQKMSQDKKTQINTNSNKNHNVPSSPVVLEKLGGSPATKTSMERPVRTLYDPNRTYSSLLGGGVAGTPGSGYGGAAASNANASAGVGSTATIASTGSESGSRNGHEERIENSRRNNVASESPVANEQLSYSGPVIHLSSYEDRDRGERNISAGPRMLYDPKSGSMVAVPSREETALGRGGRKERKKGRKDEGLSEKKKSKGRNVPARSRADSTSKTEKRKASNLKNERRLPRTCGVLYARDDKGACYCADGCDGDLGYGAHSVPGGRVRNAEAYVKFSEKQQQQQIYRADEVVYDELYGGGTFDSEQNKSDSALQTGFILPEKEPPTLKVDWVKPNEKITLLGGDESPTLQATASEWAPSQAALAAAAAAAAAHHAESDCDNLKEETSMTMPGNETSLILPGITSMGSQDNEDDDDSDDDGPSFMGLGFDPTQNMDSVIQSPSLRAEGPSALDSVDFGALSLEPSLGASATNSRHIFAFGSAATWGSSDAPGNNDWGAPIGSNGSRSLFDSDAFKEGEDKAATFLSLASSSSWGAAAGVPGLDGKLSTMNDHVD